MFRKAKHLGGGGRPVLPPMPWMAVASLPDEDIVAIFAYLRSIPPHPQSRGDAAAAARGPGGDRPGEPETPGTPPQEPLRGDPQVGVGRSDETTIPLAGVSPPALP
jgi:hypothetical protein